MADKTFQQLTAPGYFNFDPVTQKIKTKQISDWFNNFYTFITDKMNLFDDIFRLWATRDYTGITERTPYLRYLLSQYGLDWFNGTEQQAAALVSIVSSGYDSVSIRNFQALLLYLANEPFNWLEEGNLQIIYGSQAPAILAETFIIFSSSPTLPVTPSPTTYVERDWTAPVGWTLFPSTSTYFSRGYLDSGNIIWTAPLATNFEQIYYQVATLDDLPTGGAYGEGPYGGGPYGG